MPSRTWIVAITRLLKLDDMGKTMNYLQKQLKDPETKKDAEDCIRIYEKILEMNGGHVWASDFNHLCRVAGYVGQIPNARIVYKPTPIGYIFLKGLESQEESYATLYLRIEQEQAYERMEALGINIHAQTFEQCVNDLLYRLENNNSPEQE